MKTALLELNTKVLVLYFLRKQKKTARNFEQSFSKTKTNHFQNIHPNRNVGVTPGANSNFVAPSPSSGLVFVIVMVKPLDISTSR